MQQINHAQYQKNLKKKPIESLRFIIEDCKESLRAMPDNPKAGVYMDEINYCMMEISRRVK